MNQPESWLHRAHREGVPIIRLFNSKSALLSVGLNQRGKPAVPVGLTAGRMYFRGARPPAKRLEINRGQQVAATEEV